MIANASPAQPTVRPPVCFPNLLFRGNQNHSPELQLFTPPPLSNPRIRALDSSFVPRPHDVTSTKHDLKGPDQLTTLTILALVCVVPKDKFTSKGPLKKWKGTADSGNAVWRWFCEECGSPIAHDPEAAPPIIALKGGSLDTEIKKTLKPVCSGSWHNS